MNRLLTRAEFHADLAEVCRIYHEGVAMSADTVRVPIHPTDAMREAMTGETPYLWRRKMDKSAYEVIRQDHPEWRNVIAEPMTVVAEYQDSAEAEAHCDRLAFEWRYAEMLKTARVQSE